MEELNLFIDNIKHMSDSEKEGVVIYVVSPIYESIEPNLVNNMYRGFIIKPS